jgi:hypothetical protein
MESKKETPEPDKGDLLFKIKMLELEKERNLVMGIMLGYLLGAIITGIKML